LKLVQQASTTLLATDPEYKSREMVIRVRIDAMLRENFVICAEQRRGG
jgi:hypothetical protein